MCFYNYPPTQVTAELIHVLLIGCELELHAPLQNLISLVVALYTLVPTFFSILFLMTSSGRNIPGWLAVVDSDAVGVVVGLEVVGGAFGP